MPSREQNINSLGAAVQHNFRRTLLVPSREKIISSLGAAVQQNLTPKYIHILDKSIRRPEPPLVFLRYLLSKSTYPCETFSALSRLNFTHLCNNLKVDGKIHWPHGVRVTFGVPSISTLPRTQFLSYDQLAYMTCRRISTAIKLLSQIFFKFWKFQSFKFSFFLFFKEFLPQIKFSK